MPKPICVKCQRFFKPLHTGVAVLEQKPIESRAQPGTEEAYKWEPYKLWQGDAMKCDGCETIIISGFGYQPRWQDYEGEMPAIPEYTVNDC